MKKYDPFNPKWLDAVSEEFPNAARIRNNLAAWPQIGQAVRLESLVDEVYSRRDRGVTLLGLVNLLDLISGRFFYARQFRLNTRDN
jgi:hypothetical protein